MSNYSKSPRFLELRLKRTLIEYRKLAVVNEDGVVPNLLDSLLLTVQLHHLPEPFIHGKKCSNCLHRMHCKSIRCPSCYKEMRKRKRQGVENKIEEVEENVNECTGECAQDLTGKEYHTLPCGHKFCTICMGNRVRRGFRTCCLCDPARIPDDIREKYL